MKPDFPVRILLVAEQCSPEHEQLLVLAQTQGYEAELLDGRRTDSSEHLLTLVRRADLVLLDVGPVWQKLLLYIRQAGQTPVVVLSADASASARIHCFKAGADDCILKPWNAVEVLLRTNAILRRCLGYLQGDEVDRIESGGVALDRNAQTVLINGKSVVVTPLEFRLLWLLVYYRGRVLSKSYTWNSVLGRDYSEFDRSIDMHLSRVRKKLSKAGLAADRLKTVRNRGYSFN